MKMTRHPLGPRSALVALTCLIVAALPLGCAPAADMPASPSDGPDAEAELVEYLMTLRLGTVHFPTSASEGCPTVFRPGRRGVSQLHLLRRRHSLSSGAGGRARFRDGLLG